MTKNEALQTRAEVSNLRECERAEIKPLAETPGEYGVAAVWADGTGREFFASRDEFAAWVEQHFSLRKALKEIADHLSTVLEIAGGARLPCAGQGAGVICTRDNERKPESYCINCGIHDDATKLAQLVDRARRIAPSDGA